jgi:hypothetical protein
MGCAPSYPEQSTPVPKVYDSFELEIGDIEVTQQAVVVGGDGTPKTPKQQG